MMKKHLKPFTIALISLVLIAFPTPHVNSCGGGDYPGDNTWFFLPNLVNQEALIPFTYCRSWFFTPSSDLDFSEDAHLYKKLTPEHYAANVDEWAQVVPNVPKEDIHKALYGLSSDMFYTQLKSNDFHKNAFLQALQTKKDLWEYFLVAKECEQYFTGSGWSNPSAKKLLDALPVKIKKILRGTKNPFIRQRAAYQLMKAYEYTEQQAKELPIFDEFFKNDAAAQKSWIYGHACYHYARANDSLMDVKKLYLARAFRLAPDKRYVTMLRTIPSDGYDDSQAAMFKGDLKSREATDADRTTWTIIKALRYPGRSLADIQNVYRSEPNNRELSLLIEREINKLEDWLFTNTPTNKANSFNYFRLGLTTEGVVRSDKDKENDYEDGNNSDAKQQQKSLANYKSDLAYLQEVAKIVEQIAQGGKTADKTFMNLAAAHLAFLRKDVAKTRQYVAAVRQDAKTPTNVRAQADVIDILAGIYAAAPYDKNLENSIMDLDKTMMRDTVKLMEGKTWVENIYNFIGNKFIESGRKAEGTLLLMKSAPAYLQLFGKGQPADFDAVLKIMENPQTPFEKFLSQTKTPYRYEDWDDETGTYKISPRQWDVHKIRDYKATYYLRHDQWDSARLVLATIPRSYWKQEPYKSMLYCNAFFIDLKHPHALVKADSTRFDKLAFVEKVIQLKNQFATNPSAYARNAYLIGNAYYNCSWHGNSWLMLDVAWSSGYGSSGMEGANPNMFKDNFYRHNKALEWYKKAATNTKDASLKALATFMMSWCENQALDYWDLEDKDKTPKPIVNNWLSQLSAPFSKKDYWCQQYEGLAHKYSGY